MEIFYTKISPDQRPSTAYNFKCETDRLNLPKNKNKKKTSSCSEDQNTEKTYFTYIDGSSGHVSNNPTKNRTNCIGDADDQDNSGVIDHWIVSTLVIIKTSGRKT